MRMDVVLSLLLLILPLNFIMIRVYFAFVRKKFIPKERIEDTITFDAF